MLGIKQHKNVYRILKSERINLLRKQYDAFIEEDKKRKERNEYILGRLDRMRISTALVPTRYEPTPLKDQRSMLYGLRCPEVVPKNSEFQDKIIENHQLNNHRLPTVDDTYLIQEISNNYILIPKLRPTFKTNNHEAMSVNNPRDSTTNVHGVEENTFNDKSVIPPPSDNNWQSKYEILSTLKKEEKETLTIIPQAGKCVPPLKYESPLNSNHEAINVDFDNDILADLNIDKSNKYLNELPEKDMSINKLSYALENDDNYENINNNKMNSKDITANDANTAEDVSHMLQNTNLEHNNSVVITSASTNKLANCASNEQYNLTDENSLNLQDEQIYQAEHSNAMYNIDQKAKQYVEINEKENVEDSNSLVNETAVFAAQPISANLKNEVFVEEHKSVSPQVINTPALQEDIDISAAVSQSNFTNYVETDITNIDGTKPEIEYGMSNEYDTSASNQHEIEREYMAAVDNQEPPVDISSDVKDNSVEKEELVDDTGIEAFNTEQQEMFYAEQPAEQYGYKGGNVNEGEQGYPLNEAENQNQEYSYYDNMQPEAYPVDLGENEEQTLRHDPSYQQQYVDTYETTYEQEQPQQYDIEQNIQPMQSQELEQIYDQQDIDTTEQIESVVDNEEGYNTQNLDNNEILDEQPEVNETNLKK